MLESGHPPGGPAVSIFPCLRRERSGECNAAAAPASRAAVAVTGVLARAYAYDSRPMRAIVTGGAGFIGSHLVDALLARGDEVHVVDNLSTGSGENLASAAELHELDIRDEALEQLAGRVRPEVVFHLAAQADVGTSVERPAFDAEVNVVGTVRVLEAARVAGARVVFASTGGAIYGECERPAREEDDPQPALSLRRLEARRGGVPRDLEPAVRRRAMSTCRLANVYGPRQLPTLEGGVVAIFLDRMRDGKETEIFGDGDQTRDFVYVGDVVGRNARRGCVLGGRHLQRRQRRRDRDPRAAPALRRDRRRYAGATVRGRETRRPAAQRHRPVPSRPGASLARRDYARRGPCEHVEYARLGLGGRVPGARGAADELQDPRDSYLRIGFPNARTLGIAEALSSGLTRRGAGQRSGPLRVSFPRYF